MANPKLNWLRDVAIIVQKEGRLDEELRANDILKLLADAPEVETPGIATDSDLDDEDVRKKVLQAIGRALGRYFGQRESVTFERFTISRQESTDEEGRPFRKYRFSLCSPIPPYSTPYENPGSPYTRYDFQENKNNEDTDNKCMKPIAGIEGIAGKRGCLHPPRNYIHEQKQDGRVKVTCSVCNGFVGYAPFDN